MPKLMNWPPSRGPNPHVHEWKWTPQVSVKDLPAPKVRETAAVEKDLIEKLESGAEPIKGPSPAEWKRIRHFKPKKKPLLAGTWNVWYQVEDVAALSLEQADSLLRACQDKAKVPDHFDNWFMFEPRPLWVDITYPLTRGVRLLVKPLLRETLPCKACGPEPKDARTVMSPGYFLWMVAKEYERIYKEHQKYGVWGHALSDLGFERITIRKDGVVDLFIGS